MNLVRKVIPPDYERIRRYVIGEIAKAGDVPMRLASNREIARLFGVSHPTVMKALKDLIAEGFLTVKPGSLGTFTRPGKFNSAGSSKIIGLLAFDGKQVFNMPISCELLYACSSVLLRKSVCYKAQSCFINGPSSEVDAELSALGLDAVIWLFPPPSVIPSLRKLRDSGIPVLSVDDSADAEFASVYFDHEAENCEIAGRMLDEGRRRIELFLLKSSRFKESSLAGVRKAFQERGLSYDDSFVFFDSQDEAAAASFEASLKSLKPDAIIFNHDIMRVWKALKGGLDIVSACRLYSMSLLLYDDMEYSGYVGRFDIMAAGRRMAESLLEQFEGRPALKPMPIGMKIDLEQWKGA